MVLEPKTFMEQFLVADQQLLCPLEMTLYVYRKIFIYPHPGTEEAIIQSLQLRLFMDISGSPKKALVHGSTPAVWLMSSKGGLLQRERLIGCLSN